MKNYLSTLKEKFPNTLQFIADFFNALSNKSNGHSLRKWLAVGFFWLTFKLSLEHTNSENLVIVLGIHVGMISTLIITYTVSNHQEKLLGKNNNESENNKSEE